MKFKLVEDFDRGPVKGSSINTLNEGDNTNLRKFLFSLAELAKIDLGTDTLVVHHTKKDRNKNSIRDLVLMTDHNHRSMHAKYRNKPWDENAHKAYQYIEVEDIIAKALGNLQQASYIEEQQLAYENKETK
jgi:hypothetical protein